VSTDAKVTRGAGVGAAKSVIPTVVMLMAAAYFLIPLWWLFIASTKSVGDLTTTPGLWFSDFQFFDNVADVFTRDDNIYVQWLVNSLFYAGIGGIISTLLAAMAGYALAKYSFRGREAVFSTILAGVLVPTTALALPLFLLFSKFDLTDTYWAVFLPSLVSAAVPDTLIEAGRIDGAGEFRIFFTIAMRLMSPALVTIFLFQFVAIWNNFFLPLIMLTSEELFPVTYGMFVWNSQTIRDPDLQILTIVGSFISVVPLIIAFLGLQRFWRGGLSAGAVKG
jgi:multiple sugar transport system permease protein